MYTVYRIYTAYCIHTYLYKYKLCTLWILRPSYIYLYIFCVSRHFLFIKKYPNSRLWARLRWAWKPQAARVRTHAPITSTENRKYHHKKAFYSTTNDDRRPTNLGTWSESGIAVLVRNCCTACSVWNCGFKAGEVWKAVAFGCFLAGKRLFHFGLGLGLGRGRLLRVCVWPSCTVTTYW